MNSVSLIVMHVLLPILYLLTTSEKTHCKYLLGGLLYIVEKSKDSLMQRMLRGSSCLYMWAPYIQTAILAEPGAWITLSMISYQGLPQAK